MPPAFDGGRGGSYRCDSLSTKNCWYEQAIYPLPYDPSNDNHQAYKGEYTTTLQETFGGSSYLMVESCLTQYGWNAGNTASCQRIVDKNVFPYAAFLPFGWSDINQIDLGDLRDLNYLSVHIFVNDIYTDTAGTAYGRRVYINPFSVPSSGVVGDTLNISWNVANSPWNGTFLFGGPITCGVDPSTNQFAGSASCIATGQGIAQVEIQASGPGGNGQTMVNEIRQISIGSACGNGIINPGEQCDAGGSNGSCPASCSTSCTTNSCGGLTHLACSNNACVTVAGAGANTCTSNADCAAATHLACSNNACVTVAGAGANTCTSNADCTAATHLACSNNACVTVAGAGANTCTSNADCTAATHLACQSNSCAVVAGAGANTCTSNADCTGAGSCSMQANSAIRNCSGYSEWAPVSKPNATSCYNYCVSNGANACEWESGNSQCYVEFGSGCDIVGGFSGWWAGTPTSACVAQTHLTCSNNACVTVAGAGANTCTSNADCTAATHLACQSNSCAVVAGAGANTCTSNADCTAATHLACQSNSCAVVAGAGANTCTSNADCTAATHLACSSNACISVAGAGANTCTSSADCAALTYTIEGWAWEASAVNDTGFDGPPSEPGRGGERIFLYNSDMTGQVAGPIFTSTISPLVGYFAIGGISPGNYNVVLDPVPAGYTVTTGGITTGGSNRYPVTISSSNIVHNFGLFKPQTISINFTATPGSGPSPLDVSLNAKVTGGTATGKINYSFWWNCTHTGTSVSDVSNGVGGPACGALPAPLGGTCDSNSSGYKCDAIDVADVIWTNPVNVTPSGNSITKTSGGDAIWNAGAASLQTISYGDGYVEFSTNEIGTHKLAGLGNTDPDQGSNSIKYGFYLQGLGLPVLYITESGSNPSPDQWSYAPGDIFRIAVESGVVKYYQNGTLRYTSAIAPVYPLIFDTSLYSQSPNATITNAKIKSTSQNTPAHAYLSTSTAKVIIERGTAAPAQAQVPITIIQPAPSVSNATVTVNNSNYCSAGVHATVSWNYSSAGTPPQSNQVAYQVQIDNDSDPLSGSPEWEQSGTTGTSAVTTTCNTANTITSPQTACRMTWNVLYRSWVRVQNGYGEWSPWTQMSTYCNGSSCGPATSWTTLAHQLPSPDFSVTPPNPELGLPVIFDDIFPTFDGAATFGSWSWNFGDGSVVRSTDSTVPLDVAGTNHTYVANGNYTVRLTAEDEIGISCSNASLISIQKAIPRWREVAPR